MKRGCAHSPCGHEHIEFKTFLIYHSFICFYGYEKVKDKRSNLNWYVEKPNLTHKFMIKYFFIDINKYLILKLKYKIT